MADERHNVAFMVGILLGALSGGVATLLLTPLSGQQTREQLETQLSGLRARGGGVPGHLDSGTYARLGQLSRDAAGTMTSLKGRVQATAGEGGVAALRERAQRLAGSRPDLGGVVGRLRVKVQERAGGGDSVPVGETVTFSPAGMGPAQRGTPRSEGDAKR